MMLFPGEEVPDESAINYKAIGGCPDFGESRIVDWALYDVFKTGLSGVDKVFEVEEEAEVFELAKGHQANNPEILSAGVVAAELLSGVVGFKSDAPFSMLLKYQDGAGVMFGREGFLIVDVVVVELGVNQGIL